MDLGPWPSAQGPAFPEEPQRLAGVCTESFQPRPAPAPPGQATRCPSGTRAPTVSIRTPRRGREGRGGRAGSRPGLGPGSAALHAGGRGAGVGRLSRPSRCSRRPEAWMRTRACAGGGAREPSGRGRCVGPRAGGGSGRGGAGLGPGELRPPLWGHYARSAARDLGKGLALCPLLLFCSEASVHPCARRRCFTEAPRWA